MTHILRATYLSKRHHQHYPSATMPPVLPSQGQRCGRSTASCCPYSPYHAHKANPSSVSSIPPSNHTCQLTWGQTLWADSCGWVSKVECPAGSWGSQQALSCAVQMGFDTYAFSLFQPPSSLPLRTAWNQENWLVPREQSMDLNSCITSTWRSWVINESLKAKPSQSQCYGNCPWSRNRG